MSPQLLIQCCLNTESWCEAIKRCDNFLAEHIMYTHTHAHTKEYKKSVDLLSRFAKAVMCPNSNCQLLILQCSFPASWFNSAGAPHYMRIHQWEIHCNGKVGNKFNICFQEPHMNRKFPAENFQECIQNEISSCLYLATETAGCDQLLLISPTAWSWTCH